MTVPAEPLGSELLHRVQAVFARYCVLPDRHASVAITLFTAYTHAASAFDFAPRLVLTSPEKRSGKTRCMEIVGHMAHKPMWTANASTAAIYRSLNAPITLLLDEADTVFGTKTKAEQNEDLRGILNAGFQRGTPVIRYDAARRSVEYLPTFSPVVLAAIGRLPDTITDRAVNIRLRRRKPSETVSPFRLSRDADPLRARVRPRDLDQRAPRRTQGRPARPAGRGPSRRPVGATHRRRRSGWRSLATPGPSRCRRHDRGRRTNRRRPLGRPRAPHGRSRTPGMDAVQLPDH